MHIRHALFVLAVSGASVVNAGAQSAPPLPKNDMTMSIGWFGAQYPGLERYNRWHQSLFSGAGGGHYWTDHLKTEVEAAWLSHVSVDSYEQENLDGATAYVRTGYRFQNVNLSLGQIYQFGENAWVHPYVGAGADIDYLRTAEDRPAQLAQLASATTASRSISVAKSSERDTSVRTRP